MCFDLRRKPSENQQNMDAAYSYTSSSIFSFLYRFCHLVFHSQMSFYEIDSAITTPVNIFKCFAASDFLDSQLRCHNHVQLLPFLQDSAWTEIFRQLIKRDFFSAVCQGWQNDPPRYDPYSLHFLRGCCHTLLDSESPPSLAFDDLAISAHFEILWFAVFLNEKLDL